VQLQTPPLNNTDELKLYYLPRGLAPGKYISPSVLFAVIVTAAGMSITDLPFYCSILDGNVKLQRLVPSDGYKRC
jgi:hypothetical protein